MCHQDDAGPADPAIDDIAIVAKHWLVVEKDIRTDLMFHNTNFKCPLTVKVCEVTTAC